MKRRSFIVGVCIAILFVTGVWIFFNDRPIRATRPNQDDKRRAEQLLISKVGEKRFQQLFRYEPKQSRVSSTTTQVAYHFRPLKEYGNDVVVVNYQSGQSYVNGVPDCHRDEKLCVFSVSRDRALQIARDNNFQAGDLRVDWTPFSRNGLAIRVSSCEKNMIMDIDYRDGVVLAYRPEIQCGGVPGE